jgi:hypothetical protein
MGFNNSSFGSVFLVGFHLFHPDTNFKKQVLDSSEQPETISRHQSTISRVVRIGRMGGIRWFSHGRRMVVAVRWWLSPHGGRQMVVVAAWWPSDGGCRRMVVAVRWWSPSDGGRRQMVVAVRWWWSPSDGGGCRQMVVVAVRWWWSPSDGCGHMVVVRWCFPIVSNSLSQ